MNIQHSILSKTSTSKITQLPADDMGEEEAYFSQVSYRTLIIHRI